MLFTDKVIVVTGGGNGIGRALCRRFAAEGAKAVVVADVNGDGARQVAAEIRGTAVETDVSCEANVARLVAQAIAQHGQIDLDDVRRPRDQSVGALPARRAHRHAAAGRIGWTNLPRRRRARAGAGGGRGS